MTTFLQSQHHGQLVSRILEHSINKVVLPGQDWLGVSKTMGIPSVLDIGLSHSLWVDDSVIFNVRLVATHAYPCFPLFIRQDSDVGIVREELRKLLEAVQ